MGRRLRSLQCEGDNVGLLLSVIDILGGLTRLQLGRENPLARSRRLEWPVAESSYEKKTISFTGTHEKRAIVVTDLQAKVALKPIAGCVRTTCSQ